MELERISTLATVVVAPAATVASVRVKLQAITALRNWLDAETLGATRALTELSTTSPAIITEIEFAQATHSTTRHGIDAVKRLATADAFPSVENALDAGTATVAHLDALASVTHRLSTDQKAALASHGDAIAAAAATLPPDKFRDTITQLVKRIIDPGDPIRRLKQQRAAAYLRHWTNPTTGMWCLHGEFDPETGLKLENRIRHTLEAMFHRPDLSTREASELPGGHLADPGARQDHRRSHAFTTLVCNDPTQPATTSRPEIIVVIDHETFTKGHHPGTRIITGNGSEIPAEAVQRLACDANVYTLVTDHDDIPLNLYRTTRVASHHQRNALRSLYATCAVPNCTVKFNNCQPHHITFWRNGGHTNLDNLVPLCSRHHHNVHDDGWQLALDHRRHLTVTLPDNTRLHSPPKIPLAS